MLPVGKLYGLPSVAEQPDEFRNIAKRALATSHPTALHAVDYDTYACIRCVQVVGKLQELTQRAPRDVLPQEKRKRCNVLTTHLSNISKVRSAY